MSKINKELQDLIASAIELEDQSDRSAQSDFEYTPPAAGITVGRLIEYIELGVQPQGKYAGKEKEPAETVRLTFELLNPKKNIREVESNGKTIKIADKISLKLKKSMHPKASFAKLFDKMKYGREEITHMAQMLNDPFVITVTHNVVEKEGSKRTYVNITNEAGEYTIQAPFKTDPLTEEKTTIPVPEAISELKMFLFNKPTKGTWDSLFIDGDKTVKDEKGAEKTVSKNWLQTLIKSAKNFKDSPLEQLLEGSDELPDDMDELNDEVTEDDLDALLGDAEEVVEEKKAAKAAPEKKSVKNVGAKASTTKKQDATSESAKTASPSKAKAKAKVETPAEDSSDALDELLGLSD
jgi:hypothetical protein